MTSISPFDSDDLTAALNENRDGWIVAMGLLFTKVTADEVRVEWTIGPQHQQGHGIVHRAVYPRVIEPLASVGAAVVAAARQQTVVGLENHTSFVRAVREGKLHAVARPLTRGRRTQVWEATVLDASERIVATGRVRLLCLERDAEL